jgi:RNA binding exosome subunit
MKAQFTKLYKTVSRNLNKEEKQELVRELQRVIDANGYTDDTDGHYGRRVRINANRLRVAFVWNASPQGFNYWNRVCEYTDQ